MTQEYDEDHPDVIRANAEAELKRAQARALEIEAKAKLNGFAQVLFVITDSLKGTLSNVLLFLLLILLAVFFCGGQEFILRLFGK